MNATLTYEQTIDYLFSQLPMFQREGSAAFKKDLTNIRRLCALLGHPGAKFKSIHIAGTNGKGSTAHLLSAVLQAAGFKTGLYTSPHYTDFRERIKINGQLMRQDAVIDFVERHQSDFERIQPSFFEITVAMAFDYFAHEKVDVAVIETGLGGRLDSTNVLLPELSIITNISLDHQQFLGDTIPEIAGEKAGIIKAGVPVVIGEDQLDTRPVFETKARAEGADIHFATERFSLQNIRSSWNAALVDVLLDGQLHLRDLQLGLGGTYQLRNLITSLQAFECLKKQAPFTCLEDVHLRKGFKEVKQLSNFVGRWQIIGERPTILCDSAHNEAGLQLTLSEVQQSSFGQWHIVFGMVNDKDAAKVLSFFPKNAHYYFAKANIPRGRQAAELQQIAAEMGLRGSAYGSVAEALEAAKGVASADDLIYIGGSIFVVAEVI
ncbi:MAG: folylpolyglutamate synthase/dihydrofolate synthase family protein [Bacteroidota bacterium]